LKGKTLIAVLVATASGLILFYVVHLQRQLGSLKTETGPAPEVQSPGSGVPNGVVKSPTPNGTSGSGVSSVVARPAVGVVEEKPAPLTERDIIAMEAEESRIALLDTMKKNVKLREQILDLYKLNATLSAALKSREAEIDDLRKGSPRPEVISPVEVTDAKGATFHEAIVKDVNPELGMVILDKGTTQGVKQGMSFSILRNDRAIGKVRIFEAGPNVSSAEIVRPSGAKIEKGDRALLWKD
jgi:hypothetical protein